MSSYDRLKNLSSGFSLSTPETAMGGNLNALKLETATTPETPQAQLVDDRRYTNNYGYRGGYYGAAGSNDGWKPDGQGGFDRTRTVDGNQWHEYQDVNGRHHTAYARDGNERRIQEQRIEDARKAQGRDYRGEGQPDRGGGVVGSIRRAFGFGS